MFKFKKKTKSLMKVVDVAALLLVVQTDILSFHK